VNPLARLNELQFFLSGGSIGAANNDITKSTGGVLTTTRILSQTATGLSPPTGVTYGDAVGNDVGSGTLTYTYSATAPTLRWTPPNDSIGSAVDVAVSGTYEIQGANNGGGIFVTVDAGALPGANTTDTVTIAAQSLKLFDTVTKAQSLAGLTEYRCIFVKNTGTVSTTDDKVDIGAFIAANTDGADSITIGLATQVPSTGAGVSGTDYPVDTGSETGVPAGVTFTNPTSAAPLASFDLSSTAGTTYAKAIWIKRVVPANTTDAEKLGNTFQLSFNVKV
jgi:hypothetical protein